MARLGNKSRSRVRNKARQAKIGDAMVFVSSGEPCVIVDKFGTKKNARYIVETPDGWSWSVSPNSLRKPPK